MRSPLIIVVIPKVKMLYLFFVSFFFVYRIVQRIPVVQFKIPPMKNNIIVRDVVGFPSKINANIYTAVIII